MNEVEQLANRIRLHAMRMIRNAKSSHLGGNFSMAEIMAVLYSQILNISPDIVQDPNRDRLVLSKGHAAAGYYAVLAECGFFPVEWHGHRVRVDLGLRGPDGSFVLLASSNEVTLPLARPSDRTDPEWAVLESEFEAIYALSGGIAQGDSAQLQRVMREGWGPSSSSGGWRG